MVEGRSLLLGFSALSALRFGADEGLSLCRGGKRLVLGIFVRWEMDEGDGDRAFRRYGFAVGIKPCANR